jgi:hypothetical protein
MRIMRVLLLNTMQVNPTKRRKKNAVYVEAQQRRGES